MVKVNYSANNSGGSWWLDDNDWRALEAAGWQVEWVRDSDLHRGAERFLGALASGATRTGLSLADAISEWESVTGQNSADLGCYSCCGPPHNFTEYDEAGNYVRSYSPAAPLHGEPFSE